MLGFRRLSALCVAALVLTACGGGGNSAPPTNGREKTEIRIGMLPLPEVAPIQIAIDKGYFTAEGLKVQTELISGGAAAMPDLVSGKIDILHSNYVSALLASASGTVKIKIVGAAYTAQPGNFLLMTKKGSPITEIADLKGHTVGVNTLNNISTLSVSALLKTAGLRPEDVKFVERPFPEMAGALDSGQVDVALLPEPFHQAAAKTLGAVTLTDIFSGTLTDFPIAGYLVTDAFAQQSPKTVAAFQRALRKATELARSDSTQVTAALLKYTKIDQATASTMKLGGFTTTVDPARVQRVADLMLEFGYLKQKFDVSSILAGGASG
ncbi:ABC transporter substrate-binding protein [Nonomuraea composti]|uniref:ABC transporter substrate-binding protein n=1 Tax=Nonomuraea composti TaxID=2720023 RepID=UPI0023F7C985|nr:ABC transporter substrate-binding protein [Nonomuraea sp. FMUSA5-5]